MNKAILIGNVGKTPELKEINQNLKVCKFSLATTEKINGVSKTEWHNIVAWNRAGEVLAQYLQKGSKVYIEGRLQKQEWTKDGVKQSMVEIIVEKFEFLSRAERQDDRPIEPKQLGGADQWSEDDIPF